MLKRHVAYPMQKPSNGSQNEMQRDGRKNVCNLTMVCLHTWILLHGDCYFRISDMLSTTRMPEGKGKHSPVQSSPLWCGNVYFVK